MKNSLHENPLSLYSKLLQAVLTRVRPALLASLAKRLLHTGRVVVELPQGRFWIDPFSVLGASLTRCGEFDEGIRKTIDKYLPAGGTFVDLGANEGYFTVLGARVCGPAGQVLAIEPQNRLQPVIRENLKLNAITWARCLDVAVTDVPGMVTFHLSPDSGSSGLFRTTRYSTPTQQVRARTLAQVLDEQGLESVDLMKVDIEGGEYGALMGSPEVFRQHRVKTLALDLHPEIFERDGRTRHDIGALLKDAGYTWTTEYGNSVWHAPPA